MTRVLVDLGRYLSMNWTIRKDSSGPVVRKLSARIGVKRGST
jgi:hypothetical protein